MASQVVTVAALPRAIRERVEIVTVGADFLHVEKGIFDDGIGDVEEDYLVYAVIGERFVKMHLEVVEATESGFRETTENVALTEIVQVEVRPFGNGVAHLKDPSSGQVYEVGLPAVVAKKLAAVVR